jgi:hypothetical protein
MANKDLFKQAIAEAKSIREAAIANAKEALEETLTPHLKDMLAAKLQEMENSQNEEVINEAEEELEEVSHNEEAEEEDAKEGEDQEVGDMDVDELKDLIRDIVAQELGNHGEEEVEDHGDMDAGEVEGGEDETIDLDELLAELDELSEGEETEEGVEEEVNEEMINEIGPEAIELLQGLAGAGALIGGSAALNSWLEKAEAGKYGDKVKKMVEKLRTGAKGASAAVNPGGTRPGSAVGEGTNEELNEALETIESLRKELNEVNLLNSKLLYVNKIFKANDLSESQKVNIIAAFDKAETVKEVKLVFETVSENVVAKKQTTIKESKLGMASKATGTTAAKPEIISEVSDTVRRMQKLAGIIK